MDSFYTVTESIVILCLLVVCLKRGSRGLSNRTLTVAVWLMAFGTVYSIAEVALGADDLAYYLNRILGSPANPDSMDLSEFSFFTRSQFVQFSFAILTSVGFFLFALGLFLLARKATADAQDYSTSNQPER